MAEPIKMPFDVVHQIFWHFKISNTRLLALQCSEMYCLSLL